MKGRKWILAKHFQGSPKEGDLELVEFDVPEIKDGGKRVKTLLVTILQCSLLLKNIYNLPEGVGDIRI